MNEEKEIEEIAHDLCGCCTHDGVCILDGEKCDFKCTHRDIAENIYNAGYRKQSEMEWLFDDGMDRYCSNCGANALTSCFEPKQICTPYCPMCGAKMKGGAE